MKCHELQTRHALRSLAIKAVKHLLLGKLIILNLAQSTGTLRGVLLLLGNGVAISFNAGRGKGHKLAVDLLLIVFTEYESFAFTFSLGDDWAKSYNTPPEPTDFSYAFDFGGGGVGANN